MDDTTRSYTTSAINKVFGHNLSKIKIAHNFLDQFSDDEATLFSKLNALCACSFSSQANLQNIVPSPEVSTAISVAIAASGGEIPDSIALQNKVGSADLTTVAQDLSSATNALFTITGNTTLTTTAQTLGAGVNEVNTKAVALQNKIGTATLNTVPQDLSSATNALFTITGNTTLATTAQTLGAGINEINSKEIVLQNKVGSASLNTVPQDLSSATNALFTITGNTTIQVGTLRSFYSCTSLSDTSPTWIATGSNTLSGRSLNDQKCNNWSYLKEFAVIGTSKILSDTTSAHVYVSTNSNGPCYDAVGSLMTQSIEIKDTALQFTLIPSIKITCSNNVCATTPTTVQEGYSSKGYLVPSLSVACTGGSCTTNPITLIEYQQTLIPSQSVSCSSFPCTLASVSTGLTTIPARSISCVSSVCSTNAVTSTSSANYYIPSQSVTCNETVCSTSNVLIDPISLTIPSRSTTCTGTSCTSISAITITDSVGVSFSIATRAVTCGVNNVCFVASQSMTGGGYTFVIPSQNLLCSGSSCMTPDTVLYAGTTTSIAIPSLTVGMVGATAGSLYALCMYHLDN